MSEDIGTGGKTSGPEGARAAPAADSAHADAAARAGAAMGAAQPDQRRSLRNAWRNPVVLVLIAAVAVITWQWVDTRSQVAAIREELARRLRDSDSETKESLLLARQAQETLRESQAKLALLENKVAESQNQQVALEALYQELSRSRDEWALAEIEQILTIASQQLQLAGNVQAALLALQTAEGRLARSDRPQFIPIRRVLNRDIERLKAAPNLDIVGMALRLDTLIAEVDTLPLQFDARLQSSRSTARAAAERPLWERVLADTWDEMKQLVRIENMDKPDAALLLPTQVYFLRENLKLRLLNARLALLARDQTRFRSDLQIGANWLARYYDTRAKTTATALASLRQMSASSINVELPSIAESLATVRNFKASREVSRERAAR
jgi:uroporphyrin-3 C-methyltransferase